MSNEQSLTGEGPSEESLSELKFEDSGTGVEKHFPRLRFCLRAEVVAKNLQVQNHSKRLQHLRKELNYLKETEWRYDPIEKHIGQKVYDYFSYEKRMQEYEEKLEECLDILEKEENAEKDDKELQEEQVVQETSNENCFRKTGTITALDSNHGVIDKSHIFDLSLARNTHDLRIGMKVQYLAYRPDEEEHIKVVKIEQLLDTYWDDDLTENKGDGVQKLEYFGTHQRCILGLITHRNQNFIKVDTDYNELSVDLDKVSLEFLPQPGDRVYLNCNVQSDFSFVDCNGEILDVLSLYPARSKKFEAPITELYDGWGIVNGECHFTVDAVPLGYKPKIGDIVSAHAIESDRNKYIWRCIEVKLIRAAPSQTYVEESNSRKKYEQNINGLFVSSDVRFRFDKLLESCEKDLIIENTSDRTFTILRSSFVGKRSQSQLRLITPRLNDRISVNPGEKKIYRLEGTALFFGHSKEVFALTFEGGIRIAREIKIDVGMPEEEETKIETKTMHFWKNPTYVDEVWSKKYNMVPGERGSDKPRFITNQIGLYNVPEKLRKIILSTDTKANIVETLELFVPSLTKDLSFDNYCRRFQTLLYLEEIELFQCIRQYDRERAHFTREDEFLVLEIENLAEKRPSLVLGDTLRATNPWKEDGSNKCYEGVIHKVLYDRVLLKFNSGFHSQYNGEDYRIEFFFSRFSLRKQHYSINKIVRHLGESFLFPTKIEKNKKIQKAVSLDEEGNICIKERKDSLFWFNKNLNIVQKTAVVNVLRGEARPMPYVIFGPPGTGKTMTLIELILQLTTLVPNCRLLVGTPSNSAADLITTRLINCEVLKPGDFVRLLSQNYIEKDLVPDHLKKYCATCDISAEGTAKDNMIVTESGLKLKCQVKHLGRHRITISTCSTLGTLLQMSFRRDHFTHVLIDEAGQCSEPEVMTVISQVDKYNGQVVLVGDPMQLGPVILNRYAGDKGLGVSFLVRMLARRPYMKDYNRFPESAGYDPRLVTKLIYNYRSLPTILNVYNELFYDSELKPMVDKDESKEALLLKSLHDILPASEKRPTNHGTFFFGVRGENRQAPDSPSWYNAAEAKNVFLFIIQLYQKKVDASRIGIITPYQKQVKTIRNIFIEANITLPKIGSVEEFQGQERDIIIISTVRSKKSFLQLDIRHYLGFVSCTKRMNVAISRARTLLIVFGNPHLLRHDPSWQFFIRYCVEHDSYTGCDLPEEFLD